MATIGPSRHAYIQRSSRVVRRSAEKKSTHTARESGPERLKLSWSRASSASEAQNRQERRRHEQKEKCGPEPGTPGAQGAKERDAEDEDHRVLAELPWNIDAPHPPEHLGAADVGRGAGHQLPPPGREGEEEAGEEREPRVPGATGRVPRHHHGKQDVRSQEEGLPDPVASPRRRPSRRGHGTCSGHHAASSSSIPCTATR